MAIDPYNSCHRRRRINRDEGSCAEAKMGPRTKSQARREEVLIKPFRILMSSSLSRESHGSTKCSPRSRSLMLAEGSPSTTDQRLARKTPGRCNSSKRRPSPLRGNQSAAAQDRVASFQTQTTKILNDRAHVETKKDRFVWNPILVTCFQGESHHRQREINQLSRSLEEAE